MISQSHWAFFLSIPLIQHWCVGSAELCTFIIATDSDMRVRKGWSSCVKFTDISNSCVSLTNIKPGTDIEQGIPCQHHYEQFCTHLINLRQPLYFNSTEAEVCSHQIKVKTTPSEISIASGTGQVRNSHLAIKIVCSDDKGPMYRINYLGCCDAGGRVSCSPQQKVFRLS